MWVKGKSMNTLDLLNNMNMVNHFAKQSEGNVDIYYWGIEINRI